MTEIWGLAALWLGLALLAALLSIWLKVANALSEIAVGTVAQLILGAAFGAAFLGADHVWVKFLAGTGAIVLTFLAGAELDPEVFRRKWKEATAVGLISFFAPFFGCAAAARWLLGWDVEASWLAGVAMSTTSVAVVYAVMIEFGFNATDYGKTVLAACFVTDLGTVIALGLIFAPFTLKTALFVGGLGCAAPAYAYLRSADPVLLHPRRFLRLGARFDRRARRISPHAHRQGGDQDCRRVSRDPGFPIPAEGRHVYDAVDVDRPYLRHHFVPVRPIARHRHPGAVFGPGRCRDSKRGRADADRKHLVSPAPPAAESGRTGCRAGSICPVFCVAGTAELSDVHKNSCGLRWVRGGKEGV